jgi:hypothetical protein
MNKLKTFFIITLSLAFYPFEHGWCIESSSAKAAYQSCQTGDKAQQTACIESLVALSDEGVPYLEKLLKSVENRESTRDSVSQLSIRDALIRIGTDKAADALMGAALRYKCKIGYPHMGPAWTDALAGMGKKGVDRLLILSKQTETYREPWLMLEWRAQKFIWFPKKQSRPTLIARAACESIALVTDPAAMETVGSLIDAPEFQHAALLALTSTKTMGYEEKVLRVWERTQDPLALKYLLIFNREKYLPILQAKLEALDVEVARLVRDLADLRAQKVRDFVNDDSVIHLVFELGGDPAANGTLRRYIESRLWDRPYPGSTVVDAIMALALSKAPDVRPTLLALLKDTTLIDDQNGELARRCGLDGYHPAPSVPMFMVAVMALQAFGDPTVIPDIEQHNAINEPRYKRCFEKTLSTLRAAQLIDYDDELLFE